MIVKISLKSLSRLCIDRNVPIEQAYNACVQRDANDMCHMDTLHPDFPKHLFSTVKGIPEEELTDGPGSELKAILANTFGIAAKPGCRCNRHAKKMNELGADWCEKNIETIVGWLEEEAKKRKLPFIKIAASKVVRFAIWRYRRRVKK